MARSRGLTAAWFLREYVTPYLPLNWFIEAVRTTQFEGYSGSS